MLNRFCNKKYRILIGKAVQHNAGIKHLTTAPARIINDEVLSNIKSTDKYKPGCSYNGFLCTRTKYIPDFNMTAFIFEHEKTGLEYMHIDRQDTNNVFSVNFRTTPFDSTGLPHILEHSVLCGSHKYPVRDPFFKMLNRSLATFMNAMTGPDYTLYPFSSTNETDYRNLQSIYLDAVFKPNLKYLDFLQEGWRLEHTNLKDKTSDYIFKGVVYNEMKGAFSENSAVFGQKFFNQILPDHTYGYVSGGDPLDIPQLTHEDLVNFHSKYYHPSNARIYSYGNFNLDTTMQYINEQYLSDFEKIDSIHSIIPKQKRWNSPKKAHILSRYDNMGAPLEKQNQIAIGYLASDITNIYESFVMSILSELLVKGPNSYFYKSLIEPNISGGYNQMTGFDPHIRDTMFVVGLQDLAVDDFEKVSQICEQTIDAVIEKGFEKSHVEGVLHNIELGMKHQSTKFGLGLLFNLTPLWNHNGDLIKSMYVSSLVTKLKDNLAKDPKYLQKKVEFYFRNNQHKLTMTMSPDEHYEKKFTENETKNLRGKVEKLNEDDKSRIYNEGLELSAAQHSIPNTEVLPCLKLSDIKKEIEKIKLNNVNVHNVPTQICSVDTNGITYIRGILDGTKLSTEEKILLPLFTSVISQFGTKNVNYRDFDQLINLKTAGVSFHTHLIENIENIHNYELGVLFGSYCLDKNVPEMLNIFKELFTNVELKDVNRFKMLLENYMSALTVGIADSGHLYAMQSCNGLVTECGQLKEQISGIEHINLMKDMIKNNEPGQILDKIRDMSTVLFNHSNLRCALNISESSKGILEEYEKFVSNIHTREVLAPANQWNSSELLDPSCRHNVMNIPVNYCAKSLVTVPYNDPHYSSLKVLAKILSSKYLLPVVREQNGAYGAGVKITIDGILSFFSYRDPNSRSTLDVFDNSYNWVLDNLKTIDDQVLFEAKLGVLQQVDVPIAPIDKGMDKFRHGITDEIFAKHRENVLNVTKANLEAVNERYLKLGNVKAVGKCVLGPENNNLTKDGENWSKSAL